MKSIVIAFVAVVAVSADVSHLQQYLPPHQGSIPHQKYLPPIQQHGFGGSNSFIGQPQFSAQPAFGHGGSLLSHAVESQAGQAGLSFGQGSHLGHSGSILGQTGSQFGHGGSLVDVAGSSIGQGAVHFGQSGSLYGLGGSSIGQSGSLGHYGSSIVQGGSLLGVGGSQIGHSGSSIGQGGFHFGQEGSQFIPQFQGAQGFGSQSFISGQQAVQEPIPAHSFGADGYRYKTPGF